MTHISLDEPSDKNIQNFFTPLQEAVDEIKARRQNKVLFEKVEHYLNGDIPAYFSQDEPIFYLARHIATPNYEALRFVKLTQQFVHNNRLQRN